MEDKYLSEQGRRKQNYTTPMQDIASAGQVHEEIFGIGRQMRPVTEQDWQRLDEADRKARVARNFFDSGTYDKTGN